MSKLNLNPQLKYYCNTEKKIQDILKDDYKNHYPNNLYIFSGKHESRKLEVALSIVENLEQYPNILVLTDKETINIFSGIYKTVAFTDNVSQTDLYMKYDLIIFDKIDTQQKYKLILNTSYQGIYVIGLIDASTIGNTYKYIKNFDILEDNFSNISEQIAYVWCVTNINDNIIIDSSRKRNELLNMHNDKKYLDMINTMSSHENEIEVNKQNIYENINEITTSLPFFLKEAAAQINFGDDEQSTNEIRNLAKFLDEVIKNIIENDNSEYQKVPETKLFIKYWQSSSSSINELKSISQQLIQLIKEYIDNTDDVNQNNLNFDNFFKTKFSKYVKSLSNSTLER